MRIWWVNQFAVPPSEAGGTRHFTLVRELIDRGHDVTIVASSFNYLTREKASQGRSRACFEKVVDGVPFVWLRAPAYRQNSFSRLWNMIVFSGRLWTNRGVRGRARPDLIIGSSPHLLAAFAAARLAKRFRVPFVLEVRDLWPQTLIDFGKASPRHPLVRILESIERYLYRSASRIITLLPGAAEYITTKCSGAADKIVWIPNGVDFSLFPSLRSVAEDGVFTVMYAGSHGTANGLDSIVDTAAILQEKTVQEETVQETEAGRVEFRLIGGGPEKSRLRRRTEKEGIRNVRFDGPMPKNQMYRAMLEADAFIVTLRDCALYRWGMSLNKLFDYLAMGRPVVFGADLVENPVTAAGAGITVPPEDSRAMADAVASLRAMSEGERSEMGRRGRDYVEQNHDLRGSAATLEEMLEQALGTVLSS